MKSRVSVRLVAGVPSMVIYDDNFTITYRSEWSFTVRLS